MSGNGSTVYSRFLPQLLVFLEVSSWTLFVVAHPLIRAISVGIIQPCDRPNAYLSIVFSPVKIETVFPNSLPIDHGHSCEHKEDKVRGLGSVGPRISESTSTLAF